MTPQHDPVLELFSAFTREMGEIKSTLTHIHESVRDLTQELRSSNEEQRRHAERLSALETRVNRPCELAADVAGLKRDRAWIAGVAAAVGAVVGAVGGWAVELFKK